MIIETSQLQTFLAISTTGSFSKVAQKLNVTEVPFLKVLKILKKSWCSTTKKKWKKNLLHRQGKKLYFS